jgi:hypothetical protein
MLVVHTEREARRDHAEMPDRDDRRVFTSTTSGHPTTPNAAIPSQVDPADGTTKATTMTTPSANAAATVLTRRRLRIIRRRYER